MIRSAADIVLLLGAIAYGGPLFAFAVLLPLAGRLRGLSPWHVDRVYRAWGGGSGLALGAIFLGGLTSHYLRHGWHWSLGTTPQRLLLAGHLVFLVGWVSYTILEIWTLEPLRRRDGPADPPDPAAYLAARPPVVRHLGLNAGLFALAVVLVAASLV